MCRFPIFSGLNLAAAVAAFAAPLVPAPQPATPLLLRGGTVHPVSGPDLPDGDILIVAGRIAAVGQGLAAPDGTRVVDVTGRHVYPGLIAGNTVLGLHEIGSVVATRDVAELGEINPNARAHVAINPDSAHFGVTRHNGVLTALAAPLRQAPGTPAPALIAGQSALIRLEGWTWEDMTVRDTVALHIYWPEVRINRRSRSATAADEQQKNIQRRLRTIREAFATARAYQNEHERNLQPAFDARWNAMRPYVRGEQPVFIHADELKQIESALDWAETENGLRVTLVGGLDAWRVAARLKPAGIAVILGGTHQLPLRRDDAYDAPFTVAAKLYAAGVRFCIAPVDPSNQRNLAYQAAKAAAHGLPAAEALKAITLYPAQILGVGDELGSIDAGKRATLIVTDGDPLEIPTQVQMAFIDGAPIELRSHHTELYEKYQERLRRLRGAAAKGGVATN